jgi:hypothetical protein
MVIMDMQYSYITVTLEHSRSLKRRCWMRNAMKWKIAEAKERFSELIHKAGKEPQFVYNRDTLVAAVISADEFRDLHAIKEHEARQSLASRMDELRDICREESYVIETPVRKNREVKFS